MEKSEVAQTSQSVGSWRRNRSLSGGKGRFHSVYRHPGKANFKAPEIQGVSRKSGKAGRQQSRKDSNAVQAVRIYPLGDNMLMKKFNQGSSVVRIPLKKKIPQWP